MWLIGEFQILRISRVAIFFIAYDMIPVLSVQMLKGTEGVLTPNQPQPLRKTVTKPDSQWHEPVHYALCASGGGSRAPCTLCVDKKNIFEIEKWQS